MICCKIIMNIDDSGGDFDKLLGELSLKGDALWNGQSLFFGDTSGDFHEEDVERIVHESGYTKCFIEVYDRYHDPRENEATNSWIFDKLIKIAYATCEKENQEVFKEVVKGLDMLDAEIERLREIADAKTGKNKTKKKGG